MNTYDVTVTMLVTTEGNDEADAKRNARAQVERRMRTYAIIMGVGEIVQVDRTVRPDEMNKDEEDGPEDGGSWATYKERRDQWQAHLKRGEKA